MAASSRNLGLETKIFIDAASYPHGYYSTLLSLATRLVFASTVLTVGETSDGTLDSTDVMMFMKNIGAVSDTCVQALFYDRDRSFDILYTLKSNRVNPVEVLYAAFPMFLYFDPDLGGLLLEPLLRYQAWPNAAPPYAARDAGKVNPLGSQYISRIPQKERHTRSPRSVKPITKVSSVRQINPSHRSNLCSEDDSPRDCEHAVNDLCSCSKEWKRHPY